MIEITIEYTFKGQCIKVTETTSKEDMVDTYTDIAEEEIKQHITEYFLDQCLGWEKAMELEQKEFARYDKNKKITILK